VGQHELHKYDIRYIRPSHDHQSSWVMVLD